MNVRRLAAIDMYGTRGTARRRRIIVAEFILGAVGAVGFGAWLADGAVGLGDRLFGLWAIGVGLNYAPLAAYAIALSRPGALDAELDGTDTYRELRRYGLLQFWVAVPLALAGFAVRDIIADRALRTTVRAGTARDAAAADSRGAGENREPRPPR